MKNIIRILVPALIIFILAFAFFFYQKSKKTKTIDSFEECAKAGNIILETYPRQCKTADGKIFSEKLIEANKGENESGDENSKPVRNIGIPPESKVREIIVITGEARGYWFFEGNFPIKLLDENRNEIISAVALAQGDWMTENYVQFRANLSYSFPQTEKGFLVFERSNPSGLQEQNESVEVPIVFDKNSFSEI